MTDATHDSAIQDFVRLLVKGQSYATPKADDIQFTVDVRPLFDRLYEKRVSILPHFSNDFDTWMIVGEPQTALDRFMRVISRFLVPSYAAFSGGTPFIHRFDAEKPLGALGSKLFVGYYRLQSRDQDRRTILARLDDCLRLIDAGEHTRLLDLNRQPYRALLDDFQRALTAGQWDEAESLLTRISSDHLTSSANVDFLRIAWLAQQARWTDIWEHPHFEQRSNLPVPALVRAAMLTAFHDVCLTELELQENWDEIQQVIARQRPGLARLVQGRFGATHPAVLRVYAYSARLDEDHDALTRIQDDIPKEDFQTRLIMQELLGQFPPPKAMAASTGERLQAALTTGDFETAWTFSEDITDAVERLAARIQIAYLSEEPTLAQTVIDEHERLYIENQQVLYDRYPNVPGWLDSLKRRVHSLSTLNIHTWIDWFEAARADPTHTDLLDAVDSLSEVADEGFWSGDHLTALAAALAEISNEDYQRYSSYRSAVNRLTSVCIDADDFPRRQAEVADVYDYLLQFIEQDDRTATNTILLLRLQEALLTNHPTEWQTAYDRFSTWFDQPIPANQEAMLEALELLVQFGAEPATLYQWFRKWADQIIRLPNVEVAALSVWLTFAQWIQADSALLRTGLTLDVDYGQTWSTKR